MSKPALSKTELIELLETLSERLQRRRAVARLYVIGGACMALAFGRGRSTEDIDARIDTGHGALTEAAREIARERGLPEGWLNEQATSAIPRGRDRRAQTLYESPSLVVTGASAEYLLAMKLEAGRDKDIEDIAYLLERLTIKESDRALAVHEALLPDSKRRPQARALLSALARQTPGLEPPTNNTEREQAWLAALGRRGVPALRLREHAERADADGTDHARGATTSTRRGADAARARAHGMWTPGLARGSSRRHQGIHRRGANKTETNHAMNGHHPAFAFYTRRSRS